MQPWLHEDAFAFAFAMCTCKLWLQLLLYLLMLIFPCHYQLRLIARVAVSVPAPQSPAAHACSPPIALVVSVAGATSPT